MIWPSTSNTNGQDTRRKRQYSGLGNEEADSSVRRARDTAGQPGVPRIWRETPTFLPESPGIGVGGGNAQRRGCEHAVGSAG